MLLQILVILLFAAVVYFHYAQGIFSATISMALALLAATVAMGYHESLAMALLGGRFSDTASAITLISLFAGVYLVGRVVFDIVVPGNINVPLYMDKAVAAVCGIVAGLSVMGVFAVAAQSLPLADSRGLMVGRLELADTRDVQVPGPRNDVDATLREIAEENPGPEDDQGLWLPADKFAVSLVRFQSEQGAFSGASRWSQTHPDYLQQLFRQRLSMQPASKFTAVNLPSKQQITLRGAYVVPELRQIDAELPRLRDRSLDPTLVGSPSQTLLVVRLGIDASAMDRDDLFRFTPAGVRLVANGKNYHPIGTLEDASLLLLSRIDDPLAVKGAGVDLVFAVPADEVFASADANGRTARPDVFVEVKRLARVPLASTAIAEGMPELDPATSRSVLRKKLVGDRIKQVLPAWDGPTTATR